jgi:hypothetical protein
MKEQQVNEQPVREADRAATFAQTGVTVSGQHAPEHEEV